MSENKPKHTKKALYFIQLGVGEKKGCLVFQYSAYWPRNERFEVFEI